MADNLLGRSESLAPPLYQSSVYRIPDLDALDRIINGEEPGFIYARDGHPNARVLAEELARLEGADWGLICGSGMAAITVAVLALVQQGDRIVASNRLYGRTTQLFGQELSRYGVQASFVDANDLDQVAEALEKPAKLLLVETMSNPLLRVVDVPELAKLAHEKECKLIVDNTFATPALYQPIPEGADFVIESLTKLIGGHSDVTLGVLCGQGDLLAQVTAIMSIWGLASNPFDCWLALRALPTLDLRLERATENAAGLSEWLSNQPGVSQVVYPGRPDHPDHELAGALLEGRFGNMLCFDLSGGREAVNRFMRAAPAIPFSPSLGHTLTTCSHPASTSHRYVSPAERKRQGIGEGLVRLSVGVEELEQIQAELGKGLQAG